MIDSSFWDRLRVKEVLDRYVDGMYECALHLQEGFNLTDEHMIGVLNMVIDNKLSQLSRMWKKVQPIQPSFSNVPDGNYIGDLKEMKLTEAKATSKRVQVETTFEVADGDYEGKTVKRFDGVEEETGMGYFKNVCEVIGFDIPDDLELWQAAMDEFVANNVTDLYDITIKTNDKYANVYINGVSEFVKGQAEGGAVEGEQVVEETIEEGAEEVIEEVIEEVVEEQQVVVPPVRRVLAKPVSKVTVKPVVKAVVQPVRVAQPIKKVTAPPPVVQRKIVSLQRK